MPVTPDVARPIGRSWSGVVRNRTAWPLRETSSSSESSSITAAETSSSACPSPSVRRLIAIRPPDRLESYSLSRVFLTRPRRVASTRYCAESKSRRSMTLAICSPGWKASRFATCWPLESRLPEGSRDSKGQHVANLLAFQPGEQIAKVIDLRDFDSAQYLVLATRRGLVKKTRLSEYDSNRSGGLIAINLRTDGDGQADELVSAAVIDDDSELLLVSRKGQAVRFRTTPDQLRPMGRATSGVTGMKFRGDDELLAMDVITPESY